MPTIGRAAAGCAATPRGIRASLVRSLTVSFTGLAIVLISVYAAALSKGLDGSVIDAMVRWDGIHYMDIASNSYSYRPGVPSNLAFFPVFPMTMRFVASSLGISVGLAGVLIANAMTFVCAFLMDRYIVVRQSGSHQLSQGNITDRLTGTEGAPRRICSGAGVHPEVIWCALAGMLLFPASFFFRMCYSEAMFLVAILLLLSSVQAKHSPWLVAGISGVATAIRPVGVAAIPVVLWYGASQWGRGYRTLKLASVLLVSVSGLACFMFYQYAAFGSPWIFANTQNHWRIVEYGGRLDKALTLISFEPIWGSYVRDSRFYWKLTWAYPPFASMQFANPVVYCGTVVLVAVGWRLRWLRNYEVLLSAGLLLIPYVTRAYEMAFNSQGRFCIVVAPAFIALGELLSRVHWAVLALLIGGLCILLTVYTFQFALGAPFF